MKFAMMKYDTPHKQPVFKNGFGMRMHVHQSSAVLDLLDERRGAV